MSGKIVTQEEIGYATGQILERVAIIDARGKQIDEKFQDIKKDVGAIKTTIYGKDGLTTAITKLTTIMRVVSGIAAVIVGLGGFQVYFTASRPATVDVGEHRQLEREIHALILALKKKEGADG
jgi:hypothetical protein